jgi:hypothetical protein
LLNIKEIKAYKTKLVVGESVSIMTLMDQPYVYYTIDKSSSIKISQKNLKGIDVKGKYKFENFSLHPLLSKDVSKLGFFENKGPGNEKTPFYYPGDKIECQSKSTGPDSYYFQPITTLPKGEYVAWLGSIFLLFTIE